MIIVFKGSSMVTKVKITMKIFTATKEFGMLILKKRLFQRILLMFQQSNKNKLINLLTLM